MRYPIILLCGQAGVGKSTAADLLAVTRDFRVIGQADAIKELVRNPFELDQNALYGPSEARNAYLPHLNSGEFKDKLDKAAVAFNQGVVCTGSSFIGQLWALRDTMAAMAAGKAVIKLNRLLSAFFRGCADQAATYRLNTRYILQQLGTEVGRAHDELIWTRATMAAALQAIEAGAPGVVVADGRFRSEVLMAAKYGATIIRIDGETTLAGSQHVSEAELATIPKHFFDAVVVNRKEQGLEAFQWLLNDCFNFIFEPAVFDQWADAKSAADEDSGDTGTGEADTNA